MAVKTPTRPGAKAQLRYCRMSASKARVVLDLIRNKHVGEANQILTFSDRLAAEVINKILRSAVANAGHNEDIPVEELYVSECYADEGPTLKRFRPRARGRAGRIHKQTCHITVVVSRYTQDELDEQRRRAELKGAASGGAKKADAGAERRRRVAKSRAADAADDEKPTDDVAEDAVADDTVADDTVEEAAVEETAAEDTVDDTVAEDTAVDDTVAEDTAAEDTAAEDTATEDAADADTEETN